MALSVLLPVDWLNEWQCQDLVEADPMNLYRWLKLVAQAKRNGKVGDGAILNSDGTPMSVAHMRRTFGYGDEATWQKFVELCYTLDLIEKPCSCGEGGSISRCDSSCEKAYRIVKWRGVWYVPPSDTNEARAARVAKHRAAKSESPSPLHSVTVTDVTDVTQEHSIAEHSRVEHRGTVLEGELEFKQLLKPFALSWNSETTKRLRKFLSLPNTLEHKRSALKLSIAKLQDGKIQNNNFAVWNILDDAFRSINLVQLRASSPVDRLEVANEQRRKAMGVAR